MVMSAVGMDNADINQVHKKYCCRTHVSFKGGKKNSRTVFDVKINVNE